MNITWRYAGQGDSDMLGHWNHQLIADEGHRNPMNERELAARMQGWMAAEYKAVIFSSGEPVGYALFKVDTGSIFLRQFFIAREKRRSGLGRLSFQALRNQIWPKNVRLTVDVLCSNKGGMAFWRAVGYQDYSLTLEMMPETT
jgi:GNAT superfamily N-acetyltransferase